MDNKNLIRILVENDLKVTPQRVAILDIITGMKSHPTVEEIAEQLRKANPNISMGTVYNTLEVFSEKGIISKVLSKDNETRYETMKEKHHHLYCADSDRIEDYYDEDLTRLLETYFSKKDIPGFRISDLRLHISGRFTDTGNRKKTQDKN